MFQVLLTITVQWPHADLESKGKPTKSHASHCSQEKALIGSLTMNWLPRVCQHAMICRKMYRYVEAVKVTHVKARV